MDRYSVEWWARCKEGRYQQIVPASCTTVMGKGG